MELEVVPQKNYTYNDGVPAYKSGEWPGIRSSHWKGSKLILKPIRIKNSENEKPRIKHVDVKPSPEFQFRPAKKILPPFSSDLKISKAGKRYIEPHYTEPKIYMKNISMRPPEQIGIGKEIPLFQSMKHGYKFDETKDFLVEDLMTRKGRILSLSQQRNFFDIYNPGDKIYNSVEYSPDFFKMEGIVIGSTHKVRLKKTVKKGDDNFYATLDLNVKTLDPNKFWNNKCIFNERKSDEGYVQGLLNFDENILGLKKKKDEPKGNVKK